MMLRGRTMYFIINLSNLNAVPTGLLLLLGHVAKASTSETFLSYLIIFIKYNFLH